MLISLLHVLIFAPLLLYIGYSRQLPSWANWTLLGVGLGIGLYHGMKSLRMYRFINIFHALVIAPVLIAIASYSLFTPDSPPYWLYVLTIFFGYAALGYHGKKLLWT